MSIHGLGLTYTAATVTFAPGAVNDVRVNGGTEAFTLAAAGKFKKSLLVVSDADPGVAAEVTGVDADSLVLAAYPAVPADKTVVCGVEVNDTAITGLDLTYAGNRTAASA